MARGWESKSVEEQQAEFSKESRENHKGATAEDARKTTERERLKLARVNVENQLRSAQNPRYKELLTQELGELDRQIESLA